MTVTTAIPGTAATLGLPAEWRTAADPGIGLLSVEPGDGRFVSSVVVSLDRSRHEPLQEPAAVATVLLVAPVVTRVRAGADGVDVVFCHLVGSISATARQRQVVIPEGLLVITFTAATSRWSEQCALADEVFDSIRVAA